jgi:hypothetical protein
MVRTRKEGKKKTSLSAAEAHPIRQMAFDSTSMTASSLTGKLQMTASSVADKSTVLGYLDEDDIESPPPLVERGKGGRPKGITTEMVRNKKKQIGQATVAACKRYQQDERVQTTERLNQGVLLGIMQAVEQEYELPERTLNFWTIKKRVHRKNVFGQSESTTSPLAEMEPILVEYCMRLARIGQPLTKDQLTSLAISMIEGTMVEEKVKVWKRTFSNFNDTQDLLGGGWYRGFIKRNRFVLNRVRARMKDINRVLWCTTYANFKTMYDSVYIRMIEAGVAV